jgi:hypothetical protein
MSRETVHFWSGGQSTSTSSCHERFFSFKVRNRSKEARVEKTKKRQLLAKIMIYIPLVFKGLRLRLTTTYLRWIGVLVSGHRAREQLHAELILEF